MEPLNLTRYLATDPIHGGEYMPQWLAYYIRRRRENYPSVWTGWADLVIHDIEEGFATSIPRNQAGSYYDPAIQAKIMTRGNVALVIDWLEWNDPDGCYRDADRDAEGFPPLTLSAAIDAMASQLEEAE